jgi:hypothetical protein
MTHGLTQLVSAARRRARPSPALVLALVALLVAAAGPAWATSSSASAPLKPNVKIATGKASVSNGEVARAEAVCPSGTRVFSGGYGTSGQHARFFVVGPARETNAYLAYAYMPPVNINTGVGHETATITVVALCAKSGQPVVFAPAS